VVLIYFYFRPGTPICTMHACWLRDSFPELGRRNIEVFGISPDHPARLKQFETRHGLPFRLLSDSDGRIARAFGVSSRFGLPARRAFLSGWHRLWEACLVGGEQRGSVHTGRPKP
jgi:peroxiredoxin Q/BCP